MRENLLKYRHFCVFVLSVIITGVFVCFLTGYNEDKYVIIVKNNQSWMNLCSKISEYYKSECLDFRYVHNRISIQCNNDTLFDIYTSKPFPKRSENYYIHFLNQGIIYCKIDNPIPYLILHNNKQASFFETEKVVLCKWDELQKLINELKKSVDKNIIISAEKDFNLQNKCCLIKQIFDNQKHKEAILYYSYIFICPHIAPEAMDWQNYPPYESFRLKMLENDLFNQVKYSEALMENVVTLCNEHPEETAYYLIEHGYLLKKILILQEQLYQNERNKNKL